MRPYTLTFSHVSNSKIQCINSVLCITAKADMLILCGETTSQWNAVQDRNNLIHTFIHLHYCSKVWGPFLKLFEGSVLFLHVCMYLLKKQQNSNQGSFMFYQYISMMANIHDLPFNETYECKIHVQIHSFK